MELPKRIVQLVENFKSHLPAYKTGNVKEITIRNEFINPFFEELGWDMNNRSGHTEVYKEVVHEDSLKVEESMRAPDYSFRLGGVRKFFLEAKKPSVVIREDIGPAYQIRRYGWSAGLPFSILTDFEEFAVYDTSIRPKLNDSASTARIFYCTYDEYEKHWEWIASIFSKEAIPRGDFDRFAAQTKGKKGTTTVDREFLREIESWRMDLAKNISLRNALNVRQLNYAVQTTIDRILFLRICEDRGIEEYGQLGEIAVYNFSGCQDLFPRQRGFSNVRFVRENGH